MRDNVTVKYKKYSGTPVIQEITMELFSDTLLKCEADGDTVVIEIIDELTDMSATPGILKYDDLNTLIRVLLQLRNQIKETNNIVPR